MTDYFAYAFCSEHKAEAMTVLLDAVANSDRSYDLHFTPVSWDDRYKCHCHAYATYYVRELRPYELVGS